MNVTLFMILMITLTLFYFYLAKKDSDEIKGEEDYFLASRSLTFLPLTLTLLATQIGGGALMGTSEEAFKSGLYGLFYNLGMCIGFLILGLGFAGFLRNLNLRTSAEIFERYYGSSALKKWASFFSITSLFGILVAQIVACKSLFIGLGFPYPIGLILFWGVITLYTMFGGLKTVVNTDIIQVLLIIGVFVVSLVKFSFFPELDLPNFKQALMIGLDELGNSKRYLQDIDPISLICMPILFCLIEQDLVQRIFSAKSEKVAIRSSVTASILLFIFSFIPLYFGIIGRYLPGVGGDPTFSSMGILMKVLSEGTGPYMMSFVVCALCAAILSTADSLLCAISSLLVQDFFDSSSVQQGSAPKYNTVTISRWTTFIVAIGALVIGLLQTNIFQVMIKSYSLTVAAMFVPIFMLRILPAPSLLGGKLAFWTGIGLNLLGLFWWSPKLLGELWPVLMALVVYLVCYIFERKKT